MTFGQDIKAGARITSVGTVTEMLKYLHEHGYNELDTARIYTAGESEKFLSRASYKTLNFTLATKVYPYDPMTGASKLHAPASLRAVFDESLKALNTESVDIFYLHSADRKVPFVQTLREVNELHKEGKFRVLGLSNFSAFEVAEVATICREKGWVRPTLYQALYNLFSREIEKELVPALRRYGIDLVSYNPLAGGLLSGRYKGVDEKPGEGRYDAEGGYELMAGWYKHRYWHGAQFQALRILEEATEKEGCSMVELAMRWLVHHSKLRMRSEGGNDGIIVGVSKLEQVESNVKAFEGGPLSPETVEAIDRAWFTVAREGKEASFWNGELVYEYDTTREENWE